MTIEINKNDYLTTEEVIRREHSAASGSRKVTAAPMYFPVNATGNANVAPIVGTATGASATLAMAQGKAYRFISAVNCHFLLSRGTVAATVNDIYLPANTPIVISAGVLWDTVNVIKATGASDGPIQIVEVR